MQYEHLWVKIAVSSDRGSSIRIIETSRDLTFSVLGKRFVFTAMPAPLVRTMTNNGWSQTTNEQCTELITAHAWATCLNDLGGDSRGVVSVTPVSGDERIAELEKSDPRAGHHDVQVWLLKRARPNREIASSVDDDEETCPDS